MDLEPCVHEGPFGLRVHTVDSQLNKTNLACALITVWFLSNFGVQNSGTPHTSSSIPRVQHGTCSPRNIPMVHHG